LKCDAKVAGYDDHEEKEFHAATQRKEENVKLFSGRVAGDRLLLKSMIAQITFAQSAPRDGNLVASGGKLSPAVRQLFTLFQTICPQPPITE